VIFHSYVSLPKGNSYNGNFSSENDGDLSIHRWRLNNNHRCDLSAIRDSRNHAAADLGEFKNGGLLLCSG
jgi:hypothetical protein